jgi:hypothetical protein
MTAEPSEETPEQSVSAPTRDGASVSRHGNGRYSRDLEHVERDARACLLSSQGWSHSQIQRELGYGSRGDVSKAIKKVLAETAREHGTEALREQQLTAMSAASRVMWERIEHPQPLVDRLGRIVRDDDDNPVVDVQALAAAVAQVVKIAERVSRLRGLDAPRRSVQANMNVTDIEGTIELAKAALAQMGQQRAEDTRRVRMIQAQPIPDNDEP